MCKCHALTQKKDCTRGSHPQKSRRSIAAELPALTVYLAPPAFVIAPTVHARHSSRVLDVVVLKFESLVSKASNIKET